MTKDHHEKKSLVVLCAWDPRLWWFDSKTALWGPVRRFRQALQKRISPVIMKAMAASAPWTADALGDQYRIRPVADQVSKIQEVFI